MSVAQTLLAALDCDLLKEIFSTAHYKSKLNELRDTVIRIEAVLKDAEAKQELSEQERLFIEELKDAVYEADDLFDEFVTLAERNQLTEGIKVRVLSLFTKFGTAYNMTQGVKKIKSKLDAIANDKRFSLSIDPKLIKNRRPETCSYVYEADDIIGRGLDLEKIVGVLLDSNVQQNVSFLSIVGIGGLGKTALAQLVYNDERVTTAFPLKVWTCVSDENEELLDVQGVLDKILASATGGKKMNGDFTMDVLQKQLREQLLGKKFLLVLDDVWTENYEQWQNLKKFLMGGQIGSWIVVTTRSHRTAEIIGEGLKHELEGLSKEDSFRLLKKVAFGSQHSNPPEDLLKIGEDIVEECAFVPLAIRVVGSLLFGQEKNIWLKIQKLGLAQINRSKNSIIPTLKLSYYQLESPLKSCFCYCAVFRKDYVMKKDTLIRLWMAHGYIPLDDPQSPEDLAEEYFSILLRRCFLQDVKKDEDGSIESCKIHDLMHDLAQQVVGKEICRVETMNGDVDKKVRHLSLIRRTNNFSFTKKKSHLRSFLRANEPYCSDESSRSLRSFLSSRHKEFKMDQLCVAALVGNWKYLRALDLRGSRIKSLPGSIGDLIHLRYLDLSHISR
ncbi:putative disease resistance protein RGA3 [Chenopodium quinoa]|uniref:putative disease resistance protein RGA3 n=1 Tax=Chenopodium quinoa TaxID=63459 RepID=UPI000B76E406|nr:putative disease resistance protein RGA3 [Chenopodium quinoa]